MKAKPVHRKKPPTKAPRGKPGSLIAKLVKIGNSRGVRLPKTVIEQAGLEETVSIAVRGNQIILSRAEGEDPRAGWAAAFERSIAKYGPPEPIEAEWEYAANEFDKEEWTW